MAHVLILGATHTEVIPCFPQRGHPITSEGLGNLNDLVVITVISDVMLPALLGRYNGVSITKYSCFISWGFCSKVYLFYYVQVYSLVGEFTGIMQCSVEDSNAIIMDHTAM